MTAIWILMSVQLVQIFHIFQIYGLRRDVIRLQSQVNALSWRAP